jgi:NAD(P) transhydrogenase subunit beta
MQDPWTEIAYFIASISFIAGLKLLSHPDTARRGNRLAAGGMALAVFVTVTLYQKEGLGMSNFEWILGGITTGTIIGFIMARRVKMTSMPQMVSFFNGMGGACAAIIGIVEYKHYYQAGSGTSLFDGQVFIMLAGLIIGAVSFSGSMVAYGKLEGKIGDKGFSKLTWLNIGFLIAIASMLIYMMTIPHHMGFAWILLLLALIYGITFVLPIGGADMPVVISLLNSFTGVAAAFGGFLYQNQAMLTGGILVGSAGTILTVMMCKAMNRSLLNVIIGSFGSSSKQSLDSSDGSQGIVKEISVSDLAVQLKYSKRVRIVPGYGLAVAQAQHLCHELEKSLEADGVDIRFSIHPVAGRMPGHMNVLLAEADVSYDKLQEIEEANEEMDKTDVVLIIGANDVVNPAAKTDPNSPIYGMPILEVYRAKMAVVLKRGMNAGYAGIDNSLFFHANNRMLFGDAKDSIQKILSALKQL